MATVALVVYIAVHFFGMTAGGFISLFDRSKFPGFAWRFAVLSSLCTLFCCVALLIDSVRAPSFDLQLVSVGYCLFGTFGSYCITRVAVSRRRLTPSARSLIRRGARNRPRWFRQVDVWLRNHRLA